MTLALRRSIRGNERGTTLLELLVVTVIIGILTTVLVQFVFSYFLDSAEENVRTELHAKIDETFRAIEEHLPEAAGLSLINTVADPNKPTGWTATTSSPVTIIAEIYALDSNNEFIRTVPADPNSPPHKHNVIYYVDNNLLYRRALANPLATPTSPATSAEVTTCTVNGTTSSCGASYTTRDAQLTKDVTAFSAQYIDNLGNPAPSPTSAHAIEITLSLDRTISGRAVSADKTRKFTLRNL